MREEKGRAKFFNVFLEGGGGELGLQELKVIIRLI